MSRVRSAPVFRPFSLIRLTRGLRLATCDSRDTDSDTDSDAL